MQRSSTLILYIQPTMSSRKLFYQDGYFDFFLCEFVHSKHKDLNRTQYCILKSSLCDMDERAMHTSILPVCACEFSLGLCD